MSRTSVESKLSPEELFEQKMRSLTKSVIKAGKLKTRRNVGQRLRKRDKIFQKVMGEWTTNSVFIDNEKVIVQELDKSTSTPRRIEIKLASIKHVLPVDDTAEFAVTWSAPEKQEKAAAFSPLKVKEQEDGEFSFGFGPDSDDDELDDEPDTMEALKDQVLVFRASNADDSRAWVQALNRAIQISKSTGLTSSASMLREYNTLQPEDAVDDVAKLQKQSSAFNKKKHRSKLTQAEELWSRANREAKKLPSPMQTVGRTAGAIAATVSMAFVTGFVKSLLKLVVAPSPVRRATMETFQSVWVEAMTWLVPPVLFHLTGDVPKPIKKGSRYSRRRTSFRQSLPKEKTTRIFVMNSCCEADLLYMMMIAKGVEEAHGNVKGFISKDERDQLIGLGSIFELFDFVFLNRRSKDEKQDKDQESIDKHFARLHADKGYEWSVVFPERGWPSTHTVTKQNRSIEGTGKPELKMLLQPEANELEAALEALEGRKVEIYDATLAYDGYLDELPERSREYSLSGKYPIIPSYKNVLKGTASSDIHLNLKIFNRDDIVSHEGGVQGWLEERWQRKDEILQHFATYAAFPPDENEEAVRRDAFSVEGTVIPMVAVWVFNFICILFLFAYLA